MDVLFFIHPAPSPLQYFICLPGGDWCEQFVVYSSGLVSINLHILICKSTNIVLKIINGIILCKILYILLFSKFLGGISTLVYMKLFPFGYLLHKIHIIFETHNLSLSFRAAKSLS